MTQWWVNEGGHPGILAGSNFGSGGSPATNPSGNISANGALQFRSPLDRARAAQGRVPYAEWPDGYLGNIINRRNDRLVQAVKNRMTARSYQRGVHKGSRVSADDYFWTPDVNPDAGLARQAQGQRTGNVIQTPRGAPRGNPVELLAHMGKTAGMATPGQLGQKMQEARNLGENPVINPVVIQDPKYRGIFRPRYR